MNFTMLHYTGKGIDAYEAAYLLIYTKQTRLKMTPQGYEEIKNWPMEKIQEELEYMSNTIPSSWEFCDYTFLLSNCTRNFTHQLIRSRNNSYAQQTMRILDVSGFEYGIGPSIEQDENLLQPYCDHMATTNAVYKELIEEGADIQDARGVLPTNIFTNIVVKLNLRTAAELIVKRTSPRVQDEYKDFVEMLRRQIIMHHPWAEIFLRNKKHEAAEKLYDFIQGHFDKILKILNNDEITLKAKTDLIKCVDILRQE